MTPVNRPKKATMPDRKIRTTDFLNKNQKSVPKVTVGILNS